MYEYEILNLNWNEVRYLEGFISSLRLVEKMFNIKNLYYIGTTSLNTAFSNAQFSNLHFLESKGEKKGIFVFSRKGKSHSMYIKYVVRE